MQNPMENIWIANLVTSVGVGSVLWFGFKRYVSQQDERHKELDDKVNDCDERSDNIEKNYKKEFIEVRREINASNNRLGEKLTHEIREITKDKNVADKEQIKEAAEVKGEVRSLREKVEQVLRVLK
ncbi:MAG: hypothetical protein JWO92_1117 [Chitinophagaceae bacterium]|nr:hypothetical protein [Chitinophagaceae bacterium]